MANVASRMAPMIERPVRFTETGFSILCERFVPPVRAIQYEDCDPFTIRRSRGCLGASSRKLRGTLVTTGPTTAVQTASTARNHLAGIGISFQVDMASDRFEPPL
jgi:hypothetical protein